jgi:hypothetical protein
MLNDLCYFATDIICFISADMLIFVLWPVLFVLWAHVGPMSPWSSALGKTGKLAGQASWPGGQAGRGEQDGRVGQMLEDRATEGTL